MSGSGIVTPHGRSLLEQLEEADLRLAQWPELKGQVHVLECQICGDATVIVPMSSVVGRCARCGLSFARASTKFWVCLPRSVPLPEE